MAQTLRRLVATGRLSTPTRQQLLTTWPDLALVRHPVHPLLPRMWTLRESISAYDATYLALAEALGCPVLTADARLARAPGSSCSVTVVAS